jgi:electron transfer flavoprotein beta subunit
VYADDCCLVSDHEFAATDTWATSITLATTLSRIETAPDLVFTGFKTADGEKGHTGPQTVWCLDWLMMTHVVALDIDPDERVLRAKRRVEGDVEEIRTVEVPLPVFVVADPELSPTYWTAGERLRLKHLRAETRDRAEEYEDTLTVWGPHQAELRPGLRRPRRLVEHHLVGGHLPEGSGRA